ncbi:hypothetical protein [Clostridium porci]|uniref:Uncharacterized protein n=1 Tax=Clostridium porci TaxID=2605778 RepID=A0A7X2NNB7_9CLOT|nr:hypothetical protein [Clostridium porci]MSS38055.1 hypothetical protein [Clostridium porci]
MVERPPCKREAVGSSPTNSIYQKKKGRFIMKNVKNMHSIMWSRHDISIDYDSDEIRMHEYNDRIGKDSTLPSMM